MHPLGTVPTNKMHSVGTVPTNKMHPVGTVPTDKMHPVGTPNLPFDNFPYVTCASYLLLPYPALSLDITALLCSLSDRDLKGLNLQHT